MAATPILSVNGFGQSEISSARFVRVRFDAPHLEDNKFFLWGEMFYLETMPRLSIDITPEEHQKLKAIAALKGESIKNYVLKRTLGDAPDLDDMTEDEAVTALADFLKPRIEQARRGEYSTKSMDDIRREAHEQAGL